MSKLENPLLPILVMATIFVFSLNSRCKVFTDGVERSLLSHIATKLIGTKVEDKGSVGDNSSIYSIVEVHEREIPSPMEDGALVVTSGPTKYESILSDSEGRHFEMGGGSIGATVQTWKETKLAMVYNNDYELLCIAELRARDTSLDISDLDYPVGDQKKEMLELFFTDSEKTGILLKGASLNWIKVSTRPSQNLKFESIFIDAAEPRRLDENHVYRRLIHVEHFLTEMTIKKVTGVVRHYRFTGFGHVETERVTTVSESSLAKKIISAHRK